MQNDSSLKSEVMNTAAKFAARHIKPVAAETDHTAPRFPLEIFAHGVEAGFDRFALTAEAGGHGFAMAELCVLIETLSRTCAGHAMVFGVHAAAVKALAESGTTNSRAITEMILNSHAPVAVAAPCPLSLDDIDISLEAAGHDENLNISGDSGLAFNVGLTGMCMVFARKADGRPLALLARNNGGTCAFGAAEQSLGLRVMPMAALTFDRYEAGSGDVIAEGREAIDFYFSLVRNISVAVSAAAAGVMAEAVRKAFEYAAGRYQGGKMIIEHTHMKSILGGIAAGASVSGGSVFHAASMQHDTLTVLAVKKSVTDCAVKTCTDAVQVLGGYGYMRDYGIEKAMRDAAVLSLLPISNARCELLLAEIGKKNIS